MRGLEFSVTCLVILSGCGGDDGDSLNPGGAACKGSVHCVVGSSLYEFPMVPAGESCMVVGSRGAVELLPGGDAKIGQESTPSATWKRDGARLTLAAPSELIECEYKKGPPLTDNGCVSENGRTAEDGGHLCDGSSLYSCKNGKLKLERSCSGCTRYGYSGSYSTSCVAREPVDFKLYKDAIWSGPGCYWAFQKVCGISEGSSGSSGGSSACRGSGHFCGSGSVCCSGLCIGNTCS